MLAGHRLLRSCVSFVVASALALSARDALAQSATYTHEPAGFTTWASSTFDSLTSGGWFTTIRAGALGVVSDPGGSATPPLVGQWTFPIGMVGGVEPAVMAHTLPSSLTEGFAGAMWKPSNPWQGHSTGVNKIFFLLGGACGNLIPIMYGPPGGPYHLRVAPEWGNWSWLDRK